MCWNASVSIAFALVGFACAAFLFTVGHAAEMTEKRHEGKPAPSLGRGLSALHLSSRLSFLGEKVRWTKACKWHSLFVLNIACVEFCEFLIWLDVLPIEDAS